ncbi:MAG TPA: dTDP-4-dehydrorhamnose reductase [Candidatus Hydrogenedentes bacterium]|nr:dTDP-4-dehydrorhamnose reductase [Candidatus Hydrogenedentota bacterium]HOL78358.1 dTDP-4-dehydrorhamnose reductase [Candidatus Hydrogenedentota bacterium]HPO87574.1 dTDP-4-dehydrorhamnose reductase [Candidatus Hydrogenedentota bacterium]
MQTVIFGARGQLGKDLMQVFATHGDVAGYDLPEVDIADLPAVERILSQDKPDLVVNAAAYTDVEGAETHPEEAFRVNELGARTVATAAKKIQAPVVYYSTDFVFSGEKRIPYEPDDPTNPAGVYAQSKRAGEIATLENNPRAYIVRTAWLFGPGKNNFVEKIIHAASTRPELRVVEDEIGSPTYTRDLAEATYLLCQTNQFGIYHAVNAGWCSRYEFAVAIVQAVGSPTTVHPCKSSERPSPVRRPSYSVLSNARLEAVTGHKMRPWQEALQEFLIRRTS